MSQTLRVRMYRVGFGDCFLLSLIGQGPDRHILIDCGSITDGKAQVSAVVRDIVATCSSPGDTPRLELVVGTHRHRDHVAGFKDPVWKDVEVGEVWMPWTEDPEDPAATRLRNRQSAFALALSQAVAVAGFDADSDPLEVQAANEADAARQATLSIALNALTNEAAMATLHKGFAGAPPRHFLPLKDTVCEARTLPGLPGVRIHVLGPPRDEAAMASMNPPAGEAYLKMMATAASTEDLPKTGAFRPSWRIERATFEQRHPGSTFNPKDQRDVDRLAEEPDGELAAAIDRAVNNTSLILMLEIGDQWLLFPGDAQWGAWNAALKEPRCSRLLERTTFYKVGHHGSENATPRSLVDTVIDHPFTAFFSTRPVPQWPNIPRAPLVEAMKLKNVAIARSDDEAASAAASFKVEPGLYTEWQVAIGAG